MNDIFAIETATHTFSRRRFGLRWPALLLVLAACRPSPTTRDELIALHETELDFEPSTEVFARWAFPTPDPRVWVKGSARYKEVCVRDACYPLEAPHYTKVIPQADGLTPDPVVFHSPIGDIPLTLEPLPTARYDGTASDPTSPFSVLIYGCLQPFTVRWEDDRLVPTVRFSEDENDCELPRNGAAPDPECANTIARRWLEHVASGGPAQYEHRAGAVVADDARELSVFAFALGTGDQVYMDAGYGSLSGRNKRTHPMSLWTVQRQPRLRVGIDQLEVEIDRQYRAFWSFSTIASVHRRMPAILTWDDHEIRDGWGSQRDEQRGDNPHAYQLAADAYLAHQHALGPSTIPQASVEHYAQRAVVNGVPFFVFDTRSGRGKPVEPIADLGCSRAHAWASEYEGQRGILSAQQLCDFERWIAAVPDGRRAVIVSSTPMYYQLARRARIAFERISPEAKDDISDQWAHGDNYDQRAAITEILRDARRRKVEPLIVSGDIHRSVPLVVWSCQDAPKFTCAADKRENLSAAQNRALTNEKCQVLAYEIIVTGLSNEDFRTGKVLLDRAESTRHAPNIQDPVNGARVDVTNFDEMPVPNFGVLDLREDTTWISFFEVDAWGHHALTRRMLEARFDRQRCEDIEPGPGSMLDVAVPPTYSVIVP